MDAKDHATELARAHSTLNVFAGVIALLEGGTVHGGRDGGDRTAGKIIRLCEAETLRQLKRYDRHLEKITRAQQECK